MPSVKEMEIPSSLDNVALKEVEGYIERVERQAEQQVSDVTQQTTTQTTTQIRPVTDMGQIVSNQFATQATAKIILPLDKDELDIALHHKIGDGIRWVAEWCLMMMKKYPGRVFYLAPKNE